MDKLETLIETENTIIKQLTGVRNKIRKERLRLIVKKHGVRIGSIVSETKGTDHLVTKVEPSYRDRKPWLSGHPKRKDGTFGTSIRNLYDNWTLIKQ